MNKEIEITPDTKIYTLLESYPELEDELIAISPVFEKLRNSFLRNTIAKITSLKQAAVIGKVSLNELINRLRKKCNQDEGVFANDISSTGVKPDWVVEKNIMKTYNATDDINKGIHPLDKVIDETSGLEAGQIYLLITNFTPMPLIDILKKKNFNVYTEYKNENTSLTYIKRN